MTADRAPHARQCCPEPALRELTPGELRALDAWCRRAMADPDVQPRADERAAVAKYEALIDGWGRPWRQTRRDW